MEDNKGMFDLKFKELDKQYLRIQNYFTLCQDGDKQKIRNEIEIIKAECDKMDAILKDRACHSRSKEVSRLSVAQRDYERKVNDIVDYRSSESAALYAEFAIDFATSAMRHALLAVLCAIDLQLVEEDKANENEKEK